MATYRLSAQVLSRSSGRSAVAAAAYRSASELLQEMSGERFSYAHKRGVEHTEILRPQGAPDWASDRQQLWNRAEEAERRRDAQLAREVQLSLPVELSDEAQVRLVRDFAQAAFVDRGMVVDIAIHRDNPDNPHAHLMLTMRELGPEGFGAKERSWNSRALLKDWRQQWEAQANRTLEREGCLERIDCRSYRDQGVAIEPQPKLYRSAEGASSDGRDHVHDRQAEWARVARDNGERILERPEVVLDALTVQQSVFTERQVLRFLNGHTADADQFEACRVKVMASAQLVECGRERGRRLYTTKAVLESERALLRDGQTLAEDAGRHWVRESAVERACAGRTLSGEQASALTHITQQTGRLGLVEGHAGTGKSYMLEAAREVWEAEGYRVVGAALSGKAAEGLEGSSGIESRTLASLEFAWQRGVDRLGADDVLVVDEAGMVGTRQLGRVLEGAREAGAKVVLVGDRGQLQAIEAGAPFRALVERHGGRTLREVRRQRADWQREATEALAAGRVGEALDAYAGQDRVQAHRTRAEGREALVQDWADARGQGSSVMLAFRRADVAALNRAAQQVRREAGELGEAVRLPTEGDAAKDFCRGDRVVFRKNDRAVGVKNGTVGTLERVEGSKVTVRLDGGGRVPFDLGSYAHLDLGYAATVHKSQGQTVDRAYVLADPMWKRSLSYVALSRHRDSVQLYWGRDDFRSFDQLKHSLERDGGKAMAVDHGPEREREVTRPVADAEQVARPAREDFAPGLDAGQRQLLSLPAKRRMQVLRATERARRAAAPLPPAGLEEARDRYHAAKEAYTAADSRRVLAQRAVEDWDRWAQGHPVRARFRQAEREKLQARWAQAEDTFAQASARFVPLDAAYDRVLAQERDARARWKQGCEDAAARYTHLCQGLVTQRVHAFERMELGPQAERLQAMAQTLKRAVQTKDVVGREVLTPILERARAVHERAHEKNAYERLAIETAHHEPLYLPRASSARDEGQVLTIGDVKVLEPTEPGERRVRMGLAFADDGTVRALLLPEKSAQNYQRGDRVRVQKKGRYWGNVSAQPRDAVRDRALERELGRDLGRGRGRGGRGDDGPGGGMSL